MFKVAVIADPYLQTVLINTQERARLRAEFMKLPPTDVFMTAVSKPLSWTISHLWRDIAGYKQPSTTVHPNAGHHNSTIMSYKLETSKYDKQTKTYIHTPIPNCQMVNTKDGLMNTNAELDAVDRMLSSETHKPDFVLILDPRNTIAQPPQFGSVQTPNIHSRVCSYGEAEAQIRQLPLKIIV